MFLLSLEAERYSGENNRRSEPENEFDHSAQFIATMKQRVLHRWKGRCINQKGRVSRLPATGTTPLSEHNRDQIVHRHKTNAQAISRQREERGAGGESRNFHASIFISGVSYLDVHHSGEMGTPAERKECASARG